MKRSMLFNAIAAVIVSATFAEWIMQPALTSETNRPILQVTYVLLLIALIFATAEKAKLRFLFLAMAMLTPLVEIFWHIFYQVPGTGDLFFFYHEYWGSYVVASLILPIGIMATIMMLTNNNGKPTVL